MSKSITLKFTDYVVKGVADLKTWGGGNGCIDMKEFHIADYKKKTLLANINDNGFGVEKINGAICEIYENYDRTLKYLKTVEVGTIGEYTYEYLNQLV